MAVSALFMWNQIPVHPAPCSYGITFSLESLNFGSQVVGTTSSSQLVQVMNTSDLTCTTQLSGMTLSMSGAHASQFDIDQGTCGSTLAHGAVCNAYITFSPDSAGDFTDGAIFTVSVTAPNSISDTMTLSGIGTTIEEQNLSAALLALINNKDDSSGCDATASTGAAGGKSFGPAALGLVVIMGLVLGAVAIRRGTRKRG